MAVCWECKTRTFSPVHVNLLSQTKSKNAAAFYAKPRATAGIGLTAGAGSRGAQNEFLRHVIKPKHSSQPFCRDALLTKLLKSMKAATRSIEHSDIRRLVTSGLWRCGLAPMNNGSLAKLHANSGGFDQTFP